jgi:hypothetical protein
MTPGLSQPSEMAGTKLPSRGSKHPANLPQGVTNSGRPRPGVEPVVGRTSPGSHCWGCELAALHETTGFVPIARAASLMRSRAPSLDLLNLAGGSCHIRLHRWQSRFEIADGLPMPLVCITFDLEYEDSCRLVW